MGSRQRDIIFGMLLGDGFLERNGKYVRLVTDHSGKQETYVNWLASQLTNLNPKLVFKKRIDRRNLKVYDHCILRTNTSSKLEKFFSLFYEGKRKRIPPCLSKIISPMVLAVWIMDDGYKRNDCRAMRINTQSYTLEEQKIIRQSFLRIGIKVNIHKQKQHYLVYIPSSYMKKFIGMIKPYIIPSMEYKICLTP